MTFESLVIAGLSIGLSYSDILNMEIGLCIGLCNERNNQMIDYQNIQKEKKESEEVIQGTAEMLMNM